MAKGGIIAVVEEALVGGGEFIEGEVALRAIVALENPHAVVEVGEALVF